MSTGAFLQLAAYGSQDLYITGNPQITHFKSVIKRHTNFAIENIENYFDGKPAPGQKLHCKIQRTGDLIHKIYLQVDLPNLQNLTGLNSIYTSWANGIGFVLIDYIEIQIGDRVVDKQYGQWMNIWSELITPESKKNALYSMVGKHDFFTSTTQSGPLRLYIPLYFWFCNDIGLSLPTIALQNQDVRFNLKLKDFDLLWVLNCFNTTKNKLTCDLTFDHLSLLVDYIFLDDDERRYFAKNKHFYLIEQVQHISQSIDITRQDNAIDLPFNHPVKELLWVIQGDNIKLNNQWLNYSNELISVFKPTPPPPITSAVIRFEGVELFKERSEEYFRIVLPSKYHTHVPNNFIYTYSFSFDPEKIQPTGSVNFSRLDNPTLHIKTKKNTPHTVIDIYAINYNIFRIENGFSGILFAN